ncbi:MAG: Gfo/Idh/MocA family protein, partial [Candidatus Bathyarchaeia archaeon]
MVKFGIVGTGVGANFCAQGISMIHDAEIADLIAVTSRRDERAREFASKCGLKDWYTDYREMLEKADIEAVVINTPHNLHYPMALESIKSGKHVLVDKPIAVSLKQSDEMIDKARRKGVKLGVNLQSRFDPTFRKVKEAAEEQRFGRLILGEA